MPQLSQQNSALAAHSACESREVAEQRRVEDKRDSVYRDRRRMELDSIGPAFDAQLDRDRPIKVMILP